VDLREERQRNLVAEPVSALVAVTRPIIAGVLHSVGEEYLVAHGAGRSSGSPTSDAFGRQAMATAKSRLSTRFTTR